MTDYDPLTRERDTRLANAITGLILAACFVIFVAFLVIGASGCASRYTVIPADREMVPVRHAPEVGDDIYLRTREGATGWYVPDAVMLELLEAE